MPNAAVPPSGPPAENASKTAQEALAAPLRLAWPQPRPSARLRLAALLAALAAHLGALYWVTLEPPEPMAGAYGHLLDAVNISMVNVGALEARPDVVAPPAPAAAAAIDAKEGTVAESKSGPQQPEQKEQKKAPEKQPDTPMPAEAIEAPSVVKPLQEEKERKEANTAAEAGGVAARGEVLRPDTQIAPAAASPGVVREYDSYVAQALTKVKPKRLSAYGTVRVRFRISPDGEIASVEVTKSSGNKKLDDEALATVRRARFPKPPSGMTDTQRFYKYDFNSSIR